MTPGTLVLLHGPLATAAVWGAIPETLRSYGTDVVVPDLRDDSADHGYVHRADQGVANGRARNTDHGHAHGTDHDHAHGGDHSRAQRPPSTGRYVARAAMEITAHLPAQPLVLVAHNAAGALLPSLGLAQRAAHRTVGGYVFVDAEFPAPGELRGDWPDAPCGYLRTSEPYELQARQARLRGWPVRELAGGQGEDPVSTAQALRNLIAAL
ncbi:hypothetical protein [Actinomadura sp. HBU206391]|uniref:hypothetical protein n=1 Tax=Actinomadura sp. HBU206391 TaxID=2731692 RepID=UPI00164FC56E|nr:hypothetical protein [Actinomadura sp. HBU206391]MBC6457616.1 hypothetical protein [Actinomadura sp. HBU206391]